MSHPIALHDIYTTVRVVSSEHLTSFVSLDEMQRRFLEDNRRHGRYYRGEEDAISVANCHQFLNLLGPAGSGKSTFLRRIGQEAMLCRNANTIADLIRTEYVHSKLPVLIELRRFRHETVDLVAQIGEEFATCGFPEGGRFAMEALKHGKLLVLLDGLDEVSDEKLDKVIRAISDFSDRYGSSTEGNRFVTSCRTAHYKSFFSRFTDVVIAEFNNEQISAFASKWFASEGDTQENTAQRFMARLEKAQDGTALELARTPLLLTFLCITFEHGQELPPTRATLYRRALEILLREWAAERRIHNRPVYVDLHPELELDMLSEIASTFFKEDHFFFSRSEIVSSIRRFMETELHAPRTLDADQILTAIEVQQGLIVRRAQDAYSFSHLTIQEYLTAKQLWEDGTEAWTKILNEQLFNERWSVVFSLLAGMGKADELLWVMAKRAQKELWRVADDSEAVSHLLTYISERSMGPLPGTTSPQAAAISRLAVCNIVMLFMIAPVLVYKLNRSGAHFGPAVNESVNLTLDFQDAITVGLERSPAVHSADNSVNLIRHLMEKSLELRLISQNCRVDIEEALVLLREGREREQNPAEYTLAAAIPGTSFAVDW